MGPGARGPPTWLQVVSNRDLARCLLGTGRCSLAQMCGGLWRVVGGVVVVFSVCGVSLVVVACKRPAGAVGVWERIRHFRTVRTCIPALKPGEPLSRKTTQKKKWRLVVAEEAGVWT